MSGGNCLSGFKPPQGNTILEIVHKMGAAHMDTYPMGIAKDGRLNQLVIISHVFLGFDLWWILFLGQETHGK